jgi:uncharacterized protein YehS (DUF1456 family)
MDMKLLVSLVSTRAGEGNPVNSETYNEIEDLCKTIIINNMKTSTLRQIIKEEIAQSSASELLSMLAHPDFKKQLSILNNDSVNNAYENLYATLMGIERNESLNENISGVDYISVKIKKDGGVLKQVKGKVEPTSVGFVIYNEKDNNTSFNIVWDKKLNKFINGESMWYEKQDVIPDLGYEEDFIKLERPFT